MVRYVDDVYSIVETNQIVLFDDHLNTTSFSIKFTKELETEGTLSFLDVAVIRKTDGTLSTDIYRKPTYTGRYLSFSSNHPLNQKLSIARTFHSRTNNIISDEKKKIQKFHHVSDILKSNGFPSHKPSFSFKQIQLLHNKVLSSFKVLHPYLTFTFIFLRHRREEGAENTLSVIA